MQMLERTTDSLLKATQPSGTLAFPFEYYYDEMDKYKGRCIGWHWHPEFEFSFVVKGPVLCQIGTEELLLNAGDGIFINSGIIHQFTSRGNGIMQNVLFSHTLLCEESSSVHQEFVAPFLCSSVGYVLLRKEDVFSAPVIRFLSVLVAHVETEPSFRELHIISKVYDLWESFCSMNLEYISRESVSANKNRQTRMHMMMDYIRRKYAEAISLEDIAQSAMISKSETLRCFKEFVRMTPGQYLTHYRITRAKKMLITLPDSVSYIASRCGFNTVGYFCNVFKRQVGMTPEEFRSKSSRRMEGNQ